ncbi:MAG: 50S ribosomal protein L29 [Thermoplasmata archaeon]|nr:MAG: 50S ribosomal protein L29 [Thermoplasmata archaeon]
MALKIKEIESMDIEELKTKLEELKKELIKHNSQIATGTNPKSPGQVRVIKKTVARILTVLKTKGGEKKQ